jgi:RND superfamily putative drug exporter
MFNFVGQAVATPRRALLVVLAWLVVGAAVFVLSPPLGEVTTSNQDDFLPSNAEATTATKLVQERYPSTGGTPAILVFHRAEGLTEDDEASINRATAALKDNSRPELVESVLAVDGSPQLDATLRAPDGKTVMTFVTFGGSPAAPEFGEAVEWAGDAARDAVAGSGLTVAVTGPGGIIADAVRVFAQIDFRSTLFTVLLVLVLLLVIYRSPALALLPLVGVGWTLIVAQGLVATLAANAGLSLNGQVTALLSVLMFGAGTNFTLFIVSRYREELLTTTSRWDAMRLSVARIGPSITSSAGTTLAAMLALVLASLGSFRALGPSLSIAIALMLFSGLTLIPALTVLLGPVAFWPRRVSGRGGGNSRVWSAVADAVVRRPKVTLMATMVVLIVMCLGVPTLKPNFSFLSGFPDGLSSKIGAGILDDSFGAGEFAPTNVFVTSPGGDVYEDLVAIESISAAIAAVPGVQKVSGPSRPDGKAPVVPVETLQVAIGSIPDAAKAAISGGSFSGAGAPPSAREGSQPDPRIVGVYVAGQRFIAPDGGVARLDVVMTDDPYGVPALDRISSIRQAGRQAAANAGLSEGAVVVGGVTAIQADTREAIDRDVRIIGPIVVALIWVILLGLLRSLVAATYLLGSVLISFLATLGISVVIFQNLMGHPGVGYQNAVWMFIFLAAFGADYNILIMSRIKEEIGKRGTVEGTRFAVARTGGVITSAGIILAGTFSILGTLPLRDIMQLGFAVALGTLIDTFVVRALLVPSIVVVLKQWNWWPSRQPEAPTGSEEAPKTIGG